MTRYTPTLQLDSFKEVVQVMKEDSDGEYVKFSDVEHILSYMKELKATAKWQEDDWK
jgi:hypothetical protein